MENDKKGNMMKINYEITLTITRWKLNLYFWTCTSLKEMTFRGSNTENEFKVLCNKLKNRNKDDPNFILSWKET
tara:strand:- start:101 stop:322 length:222 start_codon:yes stop_codon:yes gene_type:complete